MRGGLMHDEELTSRRIRMHGTCHGQNTRGVLQIVGKTILCKFSLDSISRAAHTGSFRISSLNHESFDDTVENQSVIKSLFYQTDKVIYSIWCNFRI